LKLFQEWEDEELKENGGRSEFKYDIFDTNLIYREAITFVATEESLKPEQSYLCDIKIQE
jgi:hypothetical protein